MAESFLILVDSVIVTLILLLFFGTHRPKKVEKAILSVDSGTQGSSYTSQNALKVLSWNLQFMAGKNHVFFYDVPDGKGPDSRPSLQSLEETFQGVADWISKEDPDVMILQEMDYRARRTRYEDQTTKLKSLLKNKYPFEARAFYWRSVFVPHPKIMGAVGTQLVTLSKVPIKKATRYALPDMQRNPLVRMFHMRRAILDCELRMGDQTFHLLNTHLEAFGARTDVMEKQVEAIREILKSYDQQKIPWFLGGDFNLVPSKAAKERLPYEHQVHYRDASEIQILLKEYSSVPALKDLEGPEHTGDPKWFTHFPNDPKITQPDRTIDYLFYSSQWNLERAAIQQEGTLKLSDHFPVVAEFRYKDWSS